MYFSATWCIVNRIVVFKSNKQIVTLKEKNGGNSKEDNKWMMKSNKRLVPRILTKFYRSSEARV